MSAAPDTFWNRPMLAGFRRKSIIATVASIVLLSIVASLVLYDLVVLRTDRLLDTLTESIYLNDGQIPQNEESLDALRQAQEKEGLNPAVNEETPYATRYFTVTQGASEQSADTSHIAAIDDAQAVRYAQDVFDSAAMSGWADNYRYGVFSNDTTKMAVFVDANSFRIKDNVVFKGSMTLIAMFSLTLVLLNLFYNIHATKPVQDSFERQKRFISNASHELKTPLTLIMTDADLAAMETGPSEYLDDIKAECRDMSDLITQMVTLSRMDEEAHPLEMTCVDVTACVESTLHSWRLAAHVKGLDVEGTIERGVFARADQAALKQILVILMDNAAKYCDPGGTITVDVRSDGRKHPCVYVENSYAKAASVQPERLFERFYRADAERADKIGHGIGLSLAKETAESLGACLDVYTKDSPSVIGFKLALKGC